MKRYYQADNNWPEIGAELKLDPPISQVFESPTHYLPGPELVAAVNAALMLGQPLLLTGEPGTGKTQLAYHVARRLGMLQPIKFEVKSTTESRDLFYSVDSIRQFRDYSIRKDKEPDPLEYIEFQALGLAILRAADQKRVEVLAKKYDHQKELDLWRDAPDTIAFPHRSVVLIDEIDKAPRDVPNDLLNEIENLYFKIPELGNLFGHHTRFTALDDLRPVVIFTSNSEKNLPAAFLRRCIYYNIEFPSHEELRGIVDARMASIKLGSALIEDVLKFVLEYLRAGPRALEDKPGTAEVLAFLLALHRLAVKDNGGLKGCYQQAKSALGTLAKNDKDLKKLSRHLETYCAV